MPGVYCLTGGVNEETGAGGVALLGALMVLLVYLLGRRLGGPVVGVLAAAARRDLSDLHRQQRADSERADRRVHAHRGRAWLPVGVGPGPRDLGVARARRACSARPRLTRPEYLPFVAVLGAARADQGRAATRLADSASPRPRCSWPRSRRARALDGPQLPRARPVRAGHDRRRQGALRRDLPARQGPPAPVKRALIERFTGNRRTSPTRRSRARR